MAERSEEKGRGGSSPNRGGSVAMDLGTVYERLEHLDEQTRRTWLDHAARAGMGIVGLVVPAVALWFVTWLSALNDDLRDARVRIRLIESTRFSQQDGAELRADLLEAFAARFPPQWMTESIQRIESATVRTAERLRDLESRLAGLEAKIEKGGK